MLSTWSWAQALGAVVLACAGAVAGPGVSFEETEHSFGTVVEGEVVEAVFRYGNRGGEELTVRGVKTSCGCTSADVTRVVLAPGASGELRIRFDTGDRRGVRRERIVLLVGPTGEAGPITPLSVHITGHVVAPLEVSPARSWFGACAPSASPQRTLTILPREAGGAVTAFDVGATVPWLEVTAVALEREGRTGFVIRVRLAPDAPLGEFRQQVFAETDDPRQPLVQVEVAGEAFPAIVTIPGELLVPADGQSYEAVLRLGRPGGDGGAFRVVRLEVPAGFSAAPERAAAGTIEVHLRLPAKHGVPPGRYPLRIHTDDPDAPLLVVPIVVLPPGWAG